MEKKQEEDAKYFKLLIKEQSSEVKTLRQQINESLKKDVSISSSFDSINPDALVNATASNYGSHVSMASKLSHFKKYTLQRYN